MSSTAVVDKQKFMPGQWLGEFMRRQRGRAEGQPYPAPTEPPPMPSSSFILGDEVIECEAEA